MKIFTHTLAAVAGASVMYLAVAQANSTDAPQGIQPGPVSAAQPGIPACEQEDGSGLDQFLPCRWDATTQGNGKGYSFVVTRNAQGSLCYHYDSPKAERKLGGCN